MSKVPSKPTSGLLVEERSGGTFEFIECGDMIGFPISHVCVVHSYPVVLDLISVFVFMFVCVFMISSQSEYALPIACDSERADPISTVYRKVPRACMGNFLGCIQESS